VDFQGRLAAYDVGNGGVTGFHAHNNSRLAFSGEALIIEDGNGSGVLLRANANANVQFAGNSELIADGNDTASLVVASERAEVNFEGQATASSDNGIAGVIAEGDSDVSFNGRMTLVDDGSTTAVLIHARDNATVQTSGVMELRHPRRAIRAGLLAEDDATVRIVGGKLQVDVAGPASLTQRLAFLECRDRARMLVSGGELAINMQGQSHAPLVLLSGESRLTLVGSGFNYPLGLVADPTGVITGTFADGNRIEIEFSRAPGAELVLVPEPPGASLLVLSATAVATRRRRLTV
jgi:hypothetical protein